MNSATTQGDSTVESVEQDLNRQGQPDSSATDAVNGQPGEPDTSSSSTESDPRAEQPSAAQPAETADPTDEPTAVDSAAQADSAPSSAYKEGQYQFQAHTKRRGCLYSPKGGLVSSEIHHCDEAFNLIDGLLRTNEITPAEAERLKLEVADSPLQVLERVTVEYVQHGYRKSGAIKYGHQTRTVKSKQQAKRLLRDLQSEIRNDQYMDSDSLQEATRAVEVSSLDDMTPEEQKEAAPAHVELATGELAWKGIPSAYIYSKGTRLFGQRFSTQGLHRLLCLAIETHKIRESERERLETAINNLGAESIEPADRLPPTSDIDKLMEELGDGRSGALVITNMKRLRSENTTVSALSRIAKLFGIKDLLDFGTSGR
jgi:hypothetical protein